MNIERSQLRKRLIIEPEEERMGEAEQRKAAAEARLRQEFSRSDFDPRWTRCSVRCPQLNHALRSPGVQGSRCSRGAALLPSDVSENRELTLNYRPTARNH
jgi:hypothetical protein